MPTIEFRVDVSGIPHSFIVMDNGSGVQQGYGFAPKEEHSLLSPGQIYNDLKHEYDYTTGPIEVTNEQYSAMVGYINNSIANPPNYNRPASPIFPGTVQQCAQWVMDVAQHGNVSLPFTMHRGGWNPYGQAVWIGVDKIINGMEQSIANLFTSAQLFVPRRDPLTLDLNGNGIETVAVNASNPILFDHEGNGIKTGTGWIAPSDGFLVLDRNGNGSIDNGTELFGDSTPLASGGNAADGFAALAQEDTNADGVVNSSDANFANLKVWQDLNQDGISQAGELKTLTELGIASINVGKTSHSSLLANGNQIADLGTFTRIDGTIGTAGSASGLADVSGRVAAQQRGTRRPTSCGWNLASDTLHRIFTDVIAVSALTATLPDMQACPEQGRRGGGMVRMKVNVMAANDAAFRLNKSTR